MAAMLSDEAAKRMSCPDWCTVVRDIEKAFELFPDPMLELARVAAQDTKDGHGRHRFALASMSNRYITSMEGATTAQIEGMVKFDANLRYVTCTSWTIVQALVAVELAFTAPILARFTNAVVGHVMDYLRALKSSAEVRDAIGMRERYEFENDAVERHVMWCVGDALTARKLNRRADAERRALRRDKSAPTPLLNVLRDAGNVEQFTVEVVNLSRGDPRCEHTQAMRTTE